MRIAFFGGLRVIGDDGAIPVTGAIQLAVFFRLAVDAGRAVAYRAIVEDVWGLDAPENERAALQSVISRLRSQLPPGSIESTAGGYRMAIARADVDTLAFEDLVAAASAASAPVDAQRLASEALRLWTGEPWIPSENFDWYEKDLQRDRSEALKLGGAPAEPRLPVARNALPLPLTALVGRQPELAMIRDQLAHSRLVTIVGTGGAGKTRLALESAREVAGAMLVELAPVGRDELYSAVLAATGRELITETLTERTGTRDRILDALVGREVLMVLDNCEHVIGEAAALAEDLLGSLPRLRILATSREPLAIPGEAFVAVGSLPHPRDDDHGDLLGYPAVELFAQRAAAASGREFGQDDLVVAAQICARLDGLPLAIELAAARLRTLGLDEVLAGLEDRFTLLTGGYRTALPRHQTLRAMIDWSWSLLDDHERRALSGLAVFPAGVDAAEAGALASALGLPAASVFDSLVDKSLLQRSRGRYRTLETIREYGIERLAEEGAVAGARALQATFECDRASANDNMIRGPRITEAIAWFDAEEDNIAAALRYSVEAPLPEVAVHLAVACAWYWIIRDRQDDARQWFPLVLPLAKDMDGPEALIMRTVEPIVTAFMNIEEGNEDPSELFASSLQLLAPLAELGDLSEQHELIQILPPMIKAFGAVATEPDWMVKVRIPTGEELGLAPWPTALAHVVRAAMAQNRGDVTELGEESLAAYEQFTAVGDLWGLALASQMRAEWLIINGQLEEALRISDLATANLRPITSSWDLAQQQGQAIVSLVRLGRIEEARARIRAIESEATSSGSPRAVLQVHTTAAFVELAAGDLSTMEQRLERIDELKDAWSTPAPTQQDALIGVIRAQVSIFRGDLETAESQMRDAAKAAFASHDQPVIGLVAINVGTLALAQGDIPKALRALDLSTALLGAYDATNPQVIQIADASEKAGIGRPAASAASRPNAIEALEALVAQWAPEA